MNSHIGTRINDLLVSTNEGKHTERKSGFTHIVNVTCSCKYHICSNLHTFAQKQTCYLHHIW